MKAFREYCQIADSVRRVVPFAPGASIWRGSDNMGQPTHVRRVASGRSQTHERIAMVALLALLFALITPLTADAKKAEEGAIVLTEADFAFGTYIIDQPGTYILGEDISFNPNSPATLTEAVETGAIPPDLAAMLGLSAPVDAYHAGSPLFTQFAYSPVEFSPGGPLDARYDPAAYGVGFFAAIAITAEDVVLDLNRHTIEQSAEHALLQRFFAVIELADQPFITGQGPSGFGDDIESAKNVHIMNGTIGRSSHHGIHGNANENVKVTNVDFVDYEVGAIALNGVQGLSVVNVNATNRKDVPVLGTFSSAQFIKPYVEDLIRSGSTTTLTVGGVEMTATDIRDALQVAINNTHADLVASPNIVDGRPQIDPVAHPDEYAVFHNREGLIDGNSYSFLVNNLGVAVDGFPHKPDGVTRIPSRDITFTNVTVTDQQSVIKEVVAIDVGGGAHAKDPVGAVFQIWNLHPTTGESVTMSSLDAVGATYVGNVAANAQAFVAKAAANGDFGASHLDISRLSIPANVVAWVEANPGSATLGDIGLSYLCNGDSMFHVNKGAIAFKMDGAVGVRLTNTHVDGLANIGESGTDLCGDYLDGYSNIHATLPGYGGAATRAYTFAGSDDVTVTDSTVTGLHSEWGSAIGFDVMTDSSNVSITNAKVYSANGGASGTVIVGSPTAPAEAIGFLTGATTTGVTIKASCATGLVGYYAAFDFYDYSGSVVIKNQCKMKL